MTEQLLKMFVTFFVVVEPISLVPLFGALTRGADASYRRKMAVKSTALSAIILVVFALVGDGSTESMQLIGKSPAVVDDEVETGSASFDGVDGTIELPNAINATSSYQISFDFKVAVGATSSARFLIDGRDAAGDGVKIEMNGGGSGRVALTQNAAAAVSALNIYNDSNWHSVVCSWDGANISLEIDDQSPVVVAEAVLSVTALARIAARSQFSSPAAFFHGFIKNVSIVLDGVTQNDLPLFPDAKDQSGQGNHGVVVGGVTFVSD